jgi:hypothetical protein
MRKLKMPNEEEFDFGTLEPKEKKKKPAPTPTVRRPPPPVRKPPKAKKKAFNFDNLQEYLFANSKKTGKTSYSINEIKWNKNQLKNIYLLMEHLQKKFDI